METADIYVVNKADLAGAERVVAELLGVLRHGKAGVQPPVIQIRAGEQSGVEELSASLDRHFAAFADPAVAAEAERVRRKYRVHKLLMRRLHEALHSVPAELWNDSVHAGYERVLQELAGGIGRGETP
jgi:LAO/AO transport system kinase